MLNSWIIHTFFKNFSSINNLNSLRPGIISKVNYVKALKYKNTSGEVLYTIDHRSPYNTLPSSLF